MSNGKFTKYYDAAKKYRFNLKAANGEIILASEAYESAAACDNGIASVKENSQSEGRYEAKESKNGKHYFALKAGNGQVIGVSEMYESPSSCKSGMGTVQRVAPQADIVDETK